MKKVIAVLLSLIMLVSVAMVPSYADQPEVTAASSLESAFAEGTNSLVVFVTGIGQSFSYLFDQSYVDEYGDDLQTYEVYGDLIAKGEYSSRREFPWWLHSTATIISCFLDSCINLFMPQDLP